MKNEQLILIKMALQTPQEDAIEDHKNFFLGWLGEDFFETK